MSPISVITVTGVLATDICKDRSIAECTSDLRCGWLPASGECSEDCLRLNEMECNVHSACTWDGRCSHVEECSGRMLSDCYRGCGVVAGQNTCRSCSSAATNTDCGRISNCEWDGQTCGKNGRECSSISNPSQCTKTGCSWRDGLCSMPSVYYDGLCQTSDTTNCIRYKNDLVPCSELTTRPLCMRQATCDWNSFSQSCVDGDLCRNAASFESCESVGCTHFDMPISCTNAIAFTKCASISDKDNCNNQKTCVFEEVENGASTCEPIIRCEQLPKSVCTEKPDCRWNSSSNTCGDSGRPCGEIRMLCGGEKCKNMVRDPDMTEYSWFGSFFDGELILGISGMPQFLKNGIPCVGCPLCQPGYVGNVGATIQCGADGIGSFGQQLCVLPGDYSDGTGTPDKPDDDDGGNNIIVIVVVVVCALLVVIVLVLFVFKYLNKKNIEKHNLNDYHGYSRELPVGYGRI